MSSESDSLASRRSKKPKYSKFTQQELPACKPMLTPGIVIGAFSLIGVFFVPIGLASLSASHNIVEVIDRYDAECVSANDKVGFIQDTKTDKACTRKITVPKPMKGPIHIYYQLENFYQNHRRYVKSRNDMQLRNKGDASTIANCEPEATSEDGGKPIVPCGLIAWSLFNDTYSFSLNSKAVQNNYNTYSFGGTKALVLSTTSWIGGRNNFIGVAYVAIGGVCLFLALAFVILYVIKPRALGDPSYLSWNRENPDHPN
ncbi:ALA-interacting subunit 1 [Zea mays]|uniref:ALA-interacting subunit n=1 Tax=Zea mays TaxID=4577 RepID=A0A1D6MA98_MAIZE|nr:ALA-interacting subunit 1 [Zea mays]